MKLLTHNLLQCPLSGTYPLKIVPTQVERTESEFRVDVMVNMLPKLEWSVLCEAARDVGFEGLPQVVPEDAAENEEFLQLLHSCIIDTHVIEGELVSQTGRRYPINDSIPNMLLQDVRALSRDRRAPSCPVAHDDYNLDRKSLDRRAPTPQLEHGYDVTQDIADASVRVASQPCNDARFCLLTLSCVYSLCRAKWLDRPHQLMRPQRPRWQTWPTRWMRPGRRTVPEKSATRSMRQNQDCRGDRGPERQRGTAKRGKEKCCGVNNVSAFVIC